MTLTAVTRGRVERPLRVLLYGVEGVGKSTFGANAPSPIFLPGEDGSHNLDVARLPKPESWADVMEAVRLLTVETHDYRTFVVDTIDAIEPLCWRFICDRDGKSSVEDYGYGKGYVTALDEWRRFLAAVERLWQSRSVTVILLAHALVKPFKNPEGDDFDRYQLKLDGKAGGLIKEWTDCNLFARFETYANRKKGELKAKGISTGARVIHTERTAAYDAKNRHDLPETMPLDWQTFADAIAAHRPADPSKLRASIEESLASLGEAADVVEEGKQEPLRRRVAVAVEAAGNNAAALAKINNRLIALVGNSTTQESANG